MLESRNVACPVITNDNLARDAWNITKNHEKWKTNFLPRPRSWPKELNKVLNPQHTYKSPMVPNQMKSAIAWQYLRTWNRQIDEGSTMQAGAGWFSRLLPLHSLVIDADEAIQNIVLHCGSWGIWVLDCFQTDSGAWQFQTGPGSVHFTSVVSASTRVVAVKECY